MQSRAHSLIESITSMLIGASIALASQLVVFPLVGIHVPLTTNLVIVAYFTAISMVRQYVVRRWFNRMTVRQSPGLRA